RDRISERLTGIGHLEEIDQECGNLLRLRLPDLRPVTLLPGYACLPERARQPDHERERDEQPCQGAYSIAPDEAGGPIGDRRGPRADRLEPQMAANVVREALDGGVPVRRIRRQGLQDNGIEIALQVARGRISGGWHLLLRRGLRGRRDPALGS